LLHTLGILEERLQLIVQLLGCSSLGRVRWVDQTILDGPIINSASQSVVALSVQLTLSTADAIHVFLSGLSQMLDIVLIRWALLVHFDLLWLGVARVNGDGVMLHVQLHTASILALQRSLQLGDALA